jgi:hypothetical protein
MDKVLILEKTKTCIRYLLSQILVLRLVTAQMAIKNNAIRKKSMVIGRTIMIRLSRSTLRMEYHSLPISNMSLN